MFVDMFDLIDDDIDIVMFGNLCCCGIYLCICVVIYDVVVKMK